MPLWISEDLDSRLIPDELANLIADDCVLRTNGYPKAFRRASPEWLKWLRDHTTAGPEEKQALRERLLEHHPEMVGKTTPLPRGYKPPELVTIPEFRTDARPSTKNGIQAPQRGMRVDGVVGDDTRIAGDVGEDA
jgi:hypothetical protein